MPTKTYKNLPYTKQSRIETAAKKVFLNNPYNRVTVSDIVKAAAIPRGSFYQYFHDLDDLYHHLFLKMFDDFANHSAALLAKHEGASIFDFMIINFTADYTFLVNSDYVQLLKKFHENRDYIGVSVSVMEKHRSDMLSAMKSKLDTDSLKQLSREEIDKIIKLISHLKFNFIHKIIAESVSYDTALADYRFYVDLIQKGAEQHHG